MPMTDQDLRALAFLAVHARPHGSKRWDEAGVIANLRKVANRDLADTVMATMRAARDRNVDSPGVIPSAGPHWSERLTPVEPPRNTGPWCSHCGQTETASIHGRDHEFTLRRQQTGDVTALIEAGRAAIAEARAARPAPKRIGPDPDARCTGLDGACIRGALHTGPCQPPVKEVQNA